MFLCGRAQPSGSRGSDRGIDGWLRFRDGRTSKSHKIVISVKSGHLQVSSLRDLRGVMAREAAEIEVLISLESPTRAMRQEAASAGFFQAVWGKHPRLQLLTIKDLFAGRGPDYPKTAGADVTFKTAPKAKRPPSEIAQDLFGIDAVAASARGRRRQVQRTHETESGTASCRAASPKRLAAAKPTMKPRDSRSRVRRERPGS